MDSTLSSSLSFHTTASNNNNILNSRRSSLVIDTPSSVASPPPQTIKMEDIEQASTVSGLVMDIPGTSTLDISPSSLLKQPSAGTPSPDQKSPPKKRKSWGQVLPEPKTNLPPRKRAKTADEKEQRRIERVKRNRLAAHNSRERKRQEVEALQSRSTILEQQLQQIMERCKALEAENAQFRKMFPQGAAEMGDLKALKSTLHDTPLQPLAVALAAQLPTPRTSPGSISQSTMTSPDSLLHTIDTPLDSISEPPTPLIEAFHHHETDSTHHSAAMMCDLQCQSVSVATASTRTSSSAPTRRRRCTLALLTSLLMLLNMGACLTAATSAFSWTTRSWARIPSASAWTRASRRRSTSPPPPAAAAAPAALSTVWRLLTSSSPTCTPAQAQLLLATSQALLRRWRILSRSSSRSDGRGRACRRGLWGDRRRQRGGFEEILRRFKRRKTQLTRTRTNG